MKKVVAVAITVIFAMSTKFAFADAYTDNRGLTWDYTYYGRYRGAVLNGVMYFRVGNGKDSSEVGKMRMLEGMKKPRAGELQGA